MAVALLKPVSGQRPKSQQRSLHGSFHTWAGRGGAWILGAPPSTRRLSNDPPSPYHNQGQTTTRGPEHEDQAWVRAKQEAFFKSPSRNPTFKVSLWALRPSRMLCPPPMRSSMPWWIFWREELNCRDSSIGMVVSESCERKAVTRLTSLLLSSWGSKRHLTAVPFGQGQARGASLRVRGIEQR